MFLKSDIEKIFEEIKISTFQFCCKNARLYFLNFNYTGYSCPFTGNIFLNLTKINKNNLSQTELKGIIAHEFGHQVSYKKRKFFDKWFWLWNYNLSKKKRREIEIEADEIAVEYGFGEYLFAERKTHLLRYSSKKRKKLSQIYLNAEEIQKIIEKNNILQNP